MKQITEITLTKQWEKLEDLIKEEIPDFILDESKTYILHYNGTPLNEIGQELYIIETENIPNEEVKGEIFKTLNCGEYKVDVENRTELYLKSYFSGAKINVKEK